MEYEVVIGLEVHAELSTQTKAFCSCTVEFGGDVNTHCCPICTGMPGMLPVLNKKVVEYGIKAGLATNCAISKESKQDRKNYFYPDLPKAYQISQFDKPLCVGGHVDINVGGEKKSIRLNRIHIEEDAGKLLHDVIDGKSLVDYNRCGVPLIEIVSEPDLRSAEEAKLYLDEIKAILECIDVSDCKMQEGSLRCDVNVSVRPKGQEEYGTRTEMKNVNSFRAAYRGIEYETARQISLLEDGERIVQETRRWNDEKGENYPMRSKEEAHDYRYFPEPDLVDIEVSDQWIEEIRASIPELPSAKLARYVENYGLGEYDASQISASKALAVFFESCAGLGGSPKTVANWILGDISKLLNETETDPADLKISPSNMVELIGLIEKGTISNTAGKKVLEQMFERDADPHVVVKELGLEQVNDTDELMRIAREVIGANPKSVEDYKNGKTNALGFLMGQVMRASKGKANPQILNTMIKEILDKE